MTALHRKSLDLVILKETEVNRWSREEANVLEGTGIGC